MSHKANDIYFENKREELEEELEIIEEATIEGRTAGGFGLRRAMESIYLLEKLNKGVFA